VTIPPVTTKTESRTVTLIDRPGSVQTNLALGRLAIDRRDPDYVPLAVTNNILGSGWQRDDSFTRLQGEEKG